MSTDVIDPGCKMKVKICFGHPARCPQQKISWHLRKLREPPTPSVAASAIAVEQQPCRSQPVNAQSIWVSFSMRIFTIKLGFLFAFFLLFFFFFFFGFFFLLCVCFSPLLFVQFFSICSTHTRHNTLTGHVIFSSAVFIRYVTTYHRYPRIIVIQTTCTLRKIFRLSIFYSCCFKFIFLDIKPRGYNFMPEVWHENLLESSFISFLFSHTAPAKIEQNESIWNY